MKKQTQISLFKLWLFVFAFTASFAQEKYKFTTYAGSVDGFQDGERLASLFRSPEGITIDAKGNLYITEYRSSIVRKIDKNGQVSLLAGQVLKTGFADSKASEALFDRPHGIALNQKGVIYICDMKNHLIRAISSNGFVSTIAGKAGEAGTADGNKNEARFSQPEGIVVNSKGELFVADSYNFTIRKIDLKGNVTTFAGKAGVGGYADGKGKNAMFNKPIGIAIDNRDNLYIADSDYDGKPSGNCLIRKIDKTGNVSTLAGVPNVQGHMDGKAKEALFHRAVGITVDSKGNVFVADTEADLIRKIDKNGMVTTIGGQYLVEKAIDGIGSEAAFFDPQSLVVAANGDIFITDTLNNKIIVGRKIK
jgi:sugar lactone lactonase YvrE